jgi:cephalosporin hydroxylase
MTPQEIFARERQSINETLGADPKARELTQSWMNFAQANKYSYQFDWLGRPIIQYPQDIVVMQELIWNIKPDLIIETGIAHGGSLILSASMLAMLDLCEAIEQKSSFNPSQSKRKVLGIDIDIRSHNRAAIEVHPMSSRIQMLEASSIAEDTVRTVKQIAAPYKTVLVFLDSNHTHEHVLSELNAYASLTTVGSYCVVFDTVVEDMPKDLFHDRPWGPGDNPKTAVWEYLKNHSEFSIDKNLHSKFLITVAPDGFLKRTK